MIMVIIKISLLYGEIVVKIQSIIDYSVIFDYDFTHMYINYIRWDVTCKLFCF
jgi:hypothetical protein